MTQIPASQSNAKIPYCSSLIGSAFICWAHRSGNNSGQFLVFGDNGD